MKTFLRRWISKSPVLFLALSLAGGAGSLAWGGDFLSPGPAPTPSSTAIPKPAPSPSPSASTAAAVTLSPDLLRTLMLNPSSVLGSTGNPSLLAELNQVYQAKDQESIARNNLLPAANLSSILGESGGPGFILSSVEFLVPFLLPSNWFNYEASQQNFQAETQSYQIVELNTYASIYALYETAVLDENLQGILQDQANDWNQIVSYLQDENAVSGTVPQQDIETAQSQADSGAAQLEATQELITSDIAQLRYALGIPLSVQISIDMSPQNAVVPQSQYEALPIATNVSTAILKSPEVQQLKDLLAAGGSTQWSDTFAWMNGLSYMAGNPYASSGQAAPDIGSGQVRGSFAFGFASFPTYTLDQDKIDAINISLNNEEIPQLTETLEQTQNSLNLANQQLTNSLNAESAMEGSYKTEKFKYDQGDASMEDLLNYRNQVTQASVARANAQGQVDQLRITLERTMLDNEFSKLPGCLDKAAPQPSLLQSIWNAVQSIFSGGADHATLDQVCRMTSS